MTFSEVVYIPHGKNTMTATFIELFTETGKSLQITPTHIIPIYKNCIDQNKGEYEMIYAANVNIGYCLLTANGTEKLVSVENSRGYGGMYTLGKVYHMYIYICIYICICICICVCVYIYVHVCLIPHI